MLRIDKVLTLASIGTRKEVKEHIYGGKIKVNGNVCTYPSTIVNENIDVITFLDEIVKMEKHYYVFNKPQGCITARKGNEKTVLDYFQNVNTTGIFPVGRLDKDTEGLLFLTNDGAFDQKLMNPDSHTNKTYFFMAVGNVLNEDIEKLEKGVDIGYEKETKPAKIKIIKKGLFENLVLEIGEEKIKYKKGGYKGKDCFFGEIIIEEGKKHQVKKMLGNINCPIIYLKRTGIGSFYLPNNLKLGEYIKIEKESLESIFIN